MLRREFLATSSLMVGATAAGGMRAFAQSGKSVLAYGAKADGKTLATRALQRAIDEAAGAGGGVVSVPAGVFLTGRLDLKSRVTLRLEAGSTLLGSTELDDYRGAPGSADAGEKHLIYAKDAEDVAITGSGRIDGQGASFWEPSGRAPLAPEERWNGVASHAFQPKKTGRPSPMVLFSNCRGVHVEGVSLENSAGWTLHALNCDNVEIRGIAIRNPIFGPNTDGIDITGSHGVLVEGCSIVTGDDAIVLKSRSTDGRAPRLVKKVVVTGCTVTTCCNGLKIGTETAGGFEDITFSNCEVISEAENLEERPVSGVALEVVDGGWINGVRVSGIRMRRARTAIFVRLGRRKPAEGDAEHGLRGVTIEDVQAAETVLASSITGIPGDMVQDVSLSNVRIDDVFPSRPEWAGSAIPEKETAYPEARMFGMLPVSGLLVRHARGIVLDKVSLTATAEESRPALMLEDVEGARIEALAATRVKGNMPVVELADVRNVSLTGCRAPEGTRTYVRVEGSGSAQVRLTGNDLSGAKKAVELGGEVSRGAVKLEEGSGGASR